MASQITYDDKVSMKTSSLPEENKCTAGNLNEIKSVVNQNAGELDNTTTKLNELVGDIQYPTYTNGGDISSSIKTYYQKIGNRVFVTLNALETISANQYLQVFILPEGYRPSIEVYNSAVRRGYNSIHQVYVNSNGVVGLFSNSAVTNGNFSGEISFIVAEEE